MIREYQDTNPDEAVNLIGLSAGTAVAVFAIEELREDHSIENAILLGSSLNADYDLTEALKRIRNRMYVFTSSRDTALRFLMPMTGTADRKIIKAKAAGVTGFRLPPRADAATRRLYARVVNIAWVPEFRTCRPCRWPHGRGEPPFRRAVCRSTRVPGRSALHAGWSAAGCGAIVRAPWRGASLSRAKLRSVVRFRIDLR